MNENGVSASFENITWSEVKNDFVVSPSKITKRYLNANEGALIVEYE